MRVILLLRTYAQHIATYYHHISEDTCPNLCPQLAMPLYKHSLKGNSGNIIYDYVRKYDTLKIEQLRKYENLKTKIRKAESDATSLRNCQIFNVTPKFLPFNLPNVSSYDLQFIKKRLLRSAVNKRKKELRSLKRDLSDHEREIGRV